jgi:hypothetical protein
MPGNELPVGVTNSGEQDHFFTPGRVAQGTKKGESMFTVNPNRAGLVLGTLGGGWHFVWALLVASGWAQAVLNFFFWIHFLSSPWVVQPFRTGLAVLLVVVTAIVWYAMGYILALLWNWIHR